MAPCIVFVGSSVDSSNNLDIHLNRLSEIRGPPLDFEDVKSALLLGEGRAAMGVGIGIGKNKAREAAFGACHSELITKSTIKRVKSILINITGGSDMSLHEIDDAVSAIAKYANPNARIIFCVSVKEDMKDTMEFTLIATGLQSI